MNAKDLRLGNLVSFKDSWFKGEYALITCIQYHCVLIKDFVGTPKIEDISPIPLTTEILIAAKFHQDNYGVLEKVKDDAPYVSGCKIEGWIKNIGNDEWDICIGEDFSTLTHLANIKYLHQLQNLYYALTKKELIIQL